MLGYLTDSLNWTRVARQLPATRAAPVAESEAQVLARALERARALARVQAAAALLAEAPALAATAAPIASQAAPATSEAAPASKAWASPREGGRPARGAGPAVPDAVRSAAPLQQQRVREAFIHAWGGYKKYAWGTDELHPTKQAGVASYGMGLTLVDSLDTMLLMGLDADFAQAMRWVETSLSFGLQEEINVFEVTIRVLGGLLSAYEISQHPALLAKADELGQQLLFAFHTPTGLPYGTVGLKTRKRYNPTWSKGASTIAEVATLQLEFRALSMHTGNPIYEAVAQRVMDHLREMARPVGLPVGLYPMFISPESGKFASSDITLGARADSLYEYLLKQWLLSSRTDGRVRAMYEESVLAIVQRLVRRGLPSRCGNCTFIASWNHKTDTYVETMDHLVCFVPGMLALGAHGPSAARDLTLAEELMETCYRMYADVPSGLAPEIASFSHATRNILPQRRAKHCLLRPETVESLFVLWRVTGRQRYRDWGWQIFQAIERHARVPTGGYCGVKDVTTSSPVQDGGPMESFFTAETLKYLYLIYGDGADVPLDEFVFNTEAHPLRIRDEYAWGARWGSLPSLSELQRRQAAARPTAQPHGCAGGCNATEAAAAEAAEARVMEHAEARAALLAAIPSAVATS